MEGAGAADVETVTAEHPGRSPLALIDGADAERTVFSEYHGMGSKTAAYMIRKGAYKLVHYVDYAPQLFDLSEDPEELNDLSQNANARPILEDLTAELYKICDPEEIDRRAKADQVRLLTDSGGKPAVIARGDLGFSVPPGVEPDFN